MKRIICLILAGFMVFSLALLSGCCLNHEWKNATCTEPKTCAKCGQTEGEALGHDWQDATCTLPITCERCGLTKGDGLGHDYAEATCTEAKTCLVCGATEGEPLGHDWQDATCTEPKTCKRCGETEGKALGHDLSDGNCTEENVCKRCEETVPAGEHDFEDATCTQPKVCRACGATEGDPLGHTTVQGVCDRCGEYISQPIEISGYGDQVIQNISVPMGVYKVSLTNEASHNFIVKAYDANGEKVDTLANEIGYYYGDVILAESIDGGILEVSSSGYWSIVFDAIPTGGTSNIEGYGDWVSPLFDLESGALIVSLTNNGEHNFVVKVYDESGKKVDTLANEIGEYSGSTVFNKGSADKKYCIEVMSSGNWSVDFGLGETVTTR